jgi:hypothetical protein
VAVTPELADAADRVAVGRGVEIRVGDGEAASAGSQVKPAVAVDGVRA